MLLLEDRNANRRRRLREAVANAIKKLMAMPESERAAVLTKMRRVEAKVATPKGI
jgi:hypothetical protein